MAQRATGRNRPRKTAGASPAPSAAETPALPETPAFIESPAPTATSAVAIAAELSAEDAAPSLAISPADAADQTPAPASVDADQPQPAPSAPVTAKTESLPAGSATTVPAAAADATTKEQTAMATTFESSKDTAEKAIGEINSRAKGAMEKSAKFAEEMTEFTKGNVEALVASGRVAAKGAETLAQDVAETMKKNFETSTSAMKSFASVKSPTELFQLQSEFAKSYFDTLVADTSKFSESMMKLAGDIAQPLSSRYAVAADRIKTASL